MSPSFLGTVCPIPSHFFPISCSSFFPSLSFPPVNFPLRGTRLRSCQDNKRFSVLLLTTAFVLFLSPTELQQVTDLKREEEALQKKLADHMKEKAALEGEVAKLRHN